MSMKTVMLLVSCGAFTSAHYKLYKFRFDLLACLVFISASRSVQSYIHSHTVEPALCSHLFLMLTPLRRVGL